MPEVAKRIAELREEFKARAQLSVNTLLDRYREHVEKRNRLGTREEEERAADERSRANKRQIAQSLFEEPFWPVTQVLRWIAFGDVDRLLEDNFRRAKWYSPASVRDANPRKTLLRALQNGNLVAIRDGGHWRDGVVRREDVLRLWRDPSASASAECEPPKARRRQLFGEVLDREIREALQTAIDRQAVKGGKRLNGKEQVGEAMKILRAKGIEAVSRGGVAISMKDRVAEIADAEFKQHRNQPYVTLKSQRAPKG